MFELSVPDLYKDFCIVELLGKNQVEVKDNHRHITKVHCKDMKKTLMPEKISQLYAEDQIGKVRNGRKAVPDSNMPDLGWDATEEIEAKEMENRTTNTTESIQEMGEDNNTIPPQTLMNIIVLIMTFIANIKSSLKRIQHFWEKTTQAVKEATSTTSRRDLPTQNRGNNRKNHPNCISPENDFRMMSTMSCTSRTHQ